MTTALRNLTLLLTAHLCCAAAENGPLYRGPGGSSERESQIGQDAHATVAEFPPLSPADALKSIHDPQPACEIPINGDGINHVRLAGDEFHFESVRDVDGL